VSAAELSTKPPEITTLEKIDTIVVPEITIPIVISENTPSSAITTPNVTPENTTAALNTEPVPSKKIIGRSGFKLPTMEEVRSGSYVPPVVIKEKEVLPTEAFKASDFKIYWNECIQRLKNRNLVSLNSLLENLDPIAIGDFQYEITLSNKIQSDLFLTEKGAINQHLRTSLNNHNIDFKITINQDLTANKPYTTSEKFKAMAEKKPILLSLKDKLGLDSEY
jgi:hypothetical protein